MKHVILSAAADEDRKAPSHRIVMVRLPAHHPSHLRMVGALFDFDYHSGLQTAVDDDVSYFLLTWLPPSLYRRR